MHPLDIIRSTGVRVLMASLGLLVLIPPAWAADSGSKPLSTEQLDQLVAPIALYPDSLVAQVLMASTYPLEVVEAARWAKSNPDLKGKALQDALEKQNWDASVKSLTAFPQTLEMMNTKLDWTTQLGDAFLAQQSEVMNAVQILRQRAKDAGNLDSNEQQTVQVENKPTGTQSQTIIIEPANPEIVYVPTYNPTMVYGPWPYPAYRPFYWYPPGYAFASSAISFGVGMAVGAALWGGCNWGHSDVNVNINKYNNFNKTNIKNSTWRHDNTHRRGAGYRDRKTQNKYGGNSSRNQKARDSFRGRAEQGRKQIARGSADKFKGMKPQAGGGVGGNRSEALRNAQSRRGSGAFSGVGNGHNSRRNGDRGRASRGGFGGGGGWGGGRGGGGRGGGRHFGGGRRR